MLDSDNKPQPIKAVVELRRVIDLSKHIKIREKITDRIYTVEGTDEELKNLATLDFVLRVNRAQVLRLIG